MAKMSIPENDSTDVKPETNIPLHHKVRRIQNDENDENVHSKVGVDNVMQELGVPGRYQVIQIVCACTSLTPMVLVMLNFVFIGYEPSTVCHTINETEVLTENIIWANRSEPIIFHYEPCKITMTVNSTRKFNDQEKDTADLTCFDGYQYPEGKDISMTAEWDLVCDSRGVAEFVQTAVMLGMAVSSALVTFVADRFGRKKVALLTTALTVITEVGLVFAANIYTSYALRFFSGLSVGALHVVHNVIALELVVSKHRQVFGIFNSVFYASNVILLSGLAFAFRYQGWRNLQLVTALFGIPTFLAAFVLKETPAWYIGKGRYKDAKRILFKACKINRKDTFPVMYIFNKCIEQIESSKVKNNLKATSSLLSANYSWIDIIRNRKLFLTMLSMCFVWFCNASAYIGLFLISSTLAGDRFLNFFLMAILEIPSSTINMAMLFCLGRRTVLLIFTAMSVICLLIATCLIATSDAETSQELNASTILCLIGKFAVGSSYNIVVIYTPELFPTTLRSTGTGLCAATSMVGTMLAPFLNPLFKIVNWAPGAILTFMSFISFLLLWTVPETRGRQLPTTIEEIMAWD